jgi:hypothetical protein
MATKSKKKPGSQGTKDRAKNVASGGASVRNRVRQMSVDALGNRKVTLRDVRNLVHEVLEGAVEGVDKSIPASRRNVLREVFEGLSEGVHAVASAGSAAASEARERGQELVGKTLPTAGKRINAANQELLGAVRSFAEKSSKQVRDELDALVARAERLGPKVAASARKTAKAADGRLIELSEETARASVRVARRAAGALAMGASGLLEGIAESITPKKRPASAGKSVKTPSGKGKKKSAKRRKT